MPFMFLVKKKRVAFLPGPDKIQLQLRFADFFLNPESELATFITKDAFSVSIQFGLHVHFRIKLIRPKAERRVHWHENQAK
ncbi:hypothetical protein VNO77_50002 [Canavalia gladiata]|uniref:Uncharacterized protein n=1 Tax=Canavalia gladiata TaxID=3824 RepID=A0AAN9JCN7_CANGL